MEQHHIDNLIKLKFSLERDIVSFKNGIERTKQHLQDIKDIIREHCCHEWIHDYIDIDVERGMNITYCKFCELSPTK